MMCRLIFAISFLLYLLKNTNGHCCFDFREPLVYNPPCACTGPTPVGVVNCGKKGSCSTCDNYASSDFSLCKCPNAKPCNCFKDTANICAPCESIKSPLCSCLSSLKTDAQSSCNCASSGSSIIYYPEVQYPQTIAELNPNYYYSTCWAY